MGTYLHGIFADDAFRHDFLNRLRAREASGVAYEAQVERVLDELADHLERHVDLERILDLASRRAR
jgi:adenosylcobyric acid synthase